MKIDHRTITIVVLIAVLAVVILFKGGCGNRTIEVDQKFIYDSLERVIISRLPPPDTIQVEKVVTKWIKGAKVVDTIYVKGSTVYVYNDTPIDTAAILSHYLTQAVTYIDTIRDSALQAIITDTIFRNKIVARGFEYKILRPLEIQNIDKRDKFQLIASFQSGGGIGYDNTPQSIYAGADLGLKFKSGTYFSVGYMAGSSHFVTIRAGQVIRLRR
jgi:hypothetical protein